MILFCVQTKTFQCPCVLRDLRDDNIYNVQNISNDPIGKPYIIFVQSDPRDIGWTRQKTVSTKTRTLRSVRLCGSNASGLRHTISGHLRTTCRMVCFSLFKSGHPRHWEVKFLSTAFCEHSSQASRAGSALAPMAGGRWQVPSRQNP